MDSSPAPRDLTAFPSRAPTVPASESRAPGTRPRLDSIDLLRGLVMVVMVLDHARGFFSASGANLRDVAAPALFLTRWITHFCAPVFVFLAGISAFLYGSRGRTTMQVSRFLATRGVWLIGLELVVVKFAWTFSLRPTSFVLQVIWAIGGGMLFLSVLVFLPRRAIGFVALLLVGGHNLLDSIPATTFGPLGWTWNLLHAPALLTIASDIQVLVRYPLIPWIGVIALGYAFGPVMLRPIETRRRWCVSIGLAALALFVVLRATQLYGDPAPRVSYDAFGPTLLSFLNCEKYPPSLLYLLMTLGPALVALGLINEVRSKVGKVIVTFGRVPMLYYVAHLFALHLIAVGYALWAIGDAGWLVGGLRPTPTPVGYGLNLPAVYVVWISVVAILYPLCSWFSGLKQRRTDGWLSYL